LTASVAPGVSQYLILGAGLDTSAFRAIARKGGLKIFEVDHPNTQSWKIEWLKAAEIPIPAQVSICFG
jgi:O-methyltransferase involved in polyketide biosynthesis